MADPMQKDHPCLAKPGPLPLTKRVTLGEKQLFTVLPVSTHPSLPREGQHTRDSDNLPMEPDPLQLFTTGG